jgi:putative ABC transport system permease protein
MQRLIKGLVLATRVLRKNPTFALGAILALALGIGANSLVFSVVNALIFHALPFPSPDRLVHVERTFETQRALRGRLSMPEVKDIEDRSQIFKAIGSYSPNAGMSFLDGTTPITVHSAFVSASIFSVFGVNPLFGRTFTPEDMYPGDAQVSVLSYSFWREHFSHDEDPIGKTITLDSKAYVVVGVMPQYFNFPPEQFDVWLPESNGSAESLSRNISNCIVIARLRDGSTLSEAQSELKSIAKWISQAHIEDRGSSLGVAFLDEEIIGPVKTGLMVLFGAVALVLLIACSNVASLVLARNVNRQREFAIRYALGASRGNIIRQLLTESVVLPAKTGHLS